MLRLFMGDMLPESVERVLYLDCDTVVLQSLKHLWKEELEGKDCGSGDGADHLPGCEGIH